jgi:two-component system chemotaxis response regulator CheY
MDESNMGPGNIHAAIVEDETDLARLYEMILAKMGVKVSFVASTGVDAVARFRESSPKPQVVLMDNRLPSMSGVDATKAILGIKPDTRIIFLSADCVARDEAIRAGAALFINKPARVSDIVGAIGIVRNGVSVAGTSQRPFVNEPIGIW